MTSLKDQLKLEIESTVNVNPVPNPTGRLGVVGYKAVDSIGNAVGTLSVDTTGVPIAVDGYAMKYVNTASAAYRQFYSDVFPVTVGEYVGGEVSFYRPPGSPGSMATRLELFWVDADGQTYATGGGYDDDTITTGTVVLDMVNTNPVPAGMVGAYLSWSISPTMPASSSLWFGKLTANRAATFAAAGATWANPTYTEVIGDTLSVTYSQGNELDGVEDKIQPGILTARVKGATVDPAANAAIYRGRRMRLSALVGATWTPQFTGTVETLSSSYVDNQTVVTLMATDAGAALTRTPLDVSSVGSLAQVLGYDVARATGVITNDGAGNAPVVGDQGAYDQGAYAADWLRRACNTFGAYSWVDKLNVVQARLRANLSTNSTTFSDTHADTGATFYTDIDATFSSEAIVNTLSVKRINNDEGVEYSKVYGPFPVPGSIAKWGNVPSEVEILDGTPLTIAEALLQTFATPTVYPSSITFNATADIIKATSLEIYQKALVKRAALINATFRILRISHTIQATNSGGKWLVTIYLRPLETGQPAIDVATPVLGPDTGPLDTLPPTDREDLSSYQTGVTSTLFDLRRSGKWREIRGNPTRNLATGSTDITTALPVGDRPSANVFANAYIAGGNVGVVFIRPNGTIALNNMSGASRSGSHQFTLIYSVD